MDKAEARTLLEAELTPLRKLSYPQLIERFLDTPQHREVYGASGAWYQIELEAFWDRQDRPGEVLRVWGSIDDGGQASVNQDFLIAPDGSFVGE